MKELFETTTINGLQLANRLVRSATWEGMCDEKGRATQRLIDTYRDLARGGVGLLISGYTYVRRDGKQLPGQMGLVDDDDIAALRNLVDAVHAAGGKLCLQLVHAGGQTTTPAAGDQPWAPSAVSVEQFPEKPQAIPFDDVPIFSAAFAAAARRAREAGCDAIQLHGAHGYLINQFLSPRTNRRKDAYGGSRENRTRFLIETYRAVRGAVGRDFPVLTKLNGSDNLAGGLTPEDALYVAQQLDAEGIDAIEVSGGTPASGDQTPVRTGIATPELEAYNLPLAGNLRPHLTCPLMTVGGIRSLEVARQALESVDYLAMARPLIREPQLPDRWRRGETHPARCTSCNGCFKPGIKEGGIRCVLEKAPA
mgnify:CR=1 FL=1